MERYEDRWITSEDGLRLYARDYGTGQSSRTVLCLHGLTRNSADFEPLAGALAPAFRVVAMDQRGRGRSDYDPDPQNYQLGRYVADTLALLDQLQLSEVAIVGTSMGGLMAMLMGGMQPQRIRGIVLNDVGPVVEAAGLKRIRGYVGRGGAAGSWDEAVLAARANNEVALPDLGDEDWLAFARRLFRETEDGRVAPAYDAAIATPMEADAEAAVPADLWPLFDGLRDIPMLVVRGELSDILSAETVAEMARRHPHLQRVEIPRRGHAPLLDEPEAVAAIQRFLAEVWPAS